MDELRILDIVADPPEVLPGATSNLQVTVADPTGVSPDVLVWTCTNLGDGCLEAADADQGTTLGVTEDGQISATLTASAALTPLVADGETVFPILAWALACAPGACPVIDLAASAPASGSDEAAELSSFLANPFDGAAQLPLQGTSLAYSQVGVSTRQAPLENPSIHADDPAPHVAAGAEVDLVFQVEAQGPSTAYGYTTLGGFSAASYDVVDGAVTLTWFGPEAAGSADLWVVVNGEDGGSAIWSGRGIVE